MPRPLSKPYTKIGIKRKRCVRCGAQAVAAWQICADGNQWRPLCFDCDRALNAMVLRWANIPDAEAKIASYKGVTA